MDMALTFGETVLCMFNVAMLLVMLGIYWEMKHGAGKTRE